MASLVLRTFQFSVEIEGKEIAQFSEVSGFDVTYDPIEYRAGDSTVYTTQKFPGLAKYGNVTFKRGVLVANEGEGEADNEFFNWINQNINGQYKKAATVTINLMDPAVHDDNTPVATWQLINAWPTKYTGPDLKAQTAELAMETLEVAHEGCTRIL